MCNVGSSCREEYNRANGSESNMWPDEDTSMARKRLHSERSRVKLNEYQPAIVPKFTEVREREIGERREERATAVGQQEG